MYHDRYSETIRNRRSLTSSGVVRPVVRSNTAMVLSRSSSDKAVTYPHSIIKESVLGGGGTTRGARLVREEPRRVRFALPDDRRSSVTSVSGVVLASHGTRYLRGTLAGPALPPAAHHPPLLAQARDSDEDGLRDTLRRASASPLPEPTINYADSSGRILYQRSAILKSNPTEKSFVNSQRKISYSESLWRVLNLAKPKYGSDYTQAKPKYGSDYTQAKPKYGSDYTQAKPKYKDRLDSSTHGAYFAFTKQSEKRN